MKTQAFTPKGKTAEQMNYGASQGIYNQKNLEEWCALANKTLYSIQYRVDTTCRRVHGVNIFSPILVCYDI